MKRLIFYISVFCLLVSSCAKQSEIEPNQVPQPRHLIYGKWESTPKVKKAPNFIFTFSENNLLKAEAFWMNADGGFTNYYDFKIVDDRAVTFYYTENVGGIKVYITAQITDDDKIKLKCHHKGNLEARIFFNPPLLCFYDDFKRS